MSDIQLPADFAQWHPYKQEAYRSGYTAAQANKSRASCPYRPGSIWAHHWLEGWRRGMQACPWRQK